MRYCQDNDLTVDGAMTDPKGDRSLAPHAQPDPDMYLAWWNAVRTASRCARRKAHQTGMLNSPRSDRYAYGFHEAGG